MMEPVIEEVLCCQYTAVSLSPITADNFLEFSFLTSSMNNPSLAPPALIVQKQSCTGDEAVHSVFQLRYHYLILDVAEIKRLKKPPQGNTIKE